MKKLKQITAIIGIILLVGLYVLAFLAAFLDHTHTMRYLAAALAATILIPVLIWVMEIFYRLNENKKKNNALFSGSTNSEDNDTGNNEHNRNENTPD